MSNENPQHFDSGVLIWLSSQFGRMERKLGELQAQTAGNRQMLVEAFHQLTHRMDRHEDRFGQRRFAWAKHVPWVKLTLFLMLTLLVATGHLTVGELKAYLIKKLTD